VLRPRIIPCLLVHQKGLVKTVRFAAPKYVGDPINAVRIFNEKEVDELVVLDIDATVEGREPDYTMIRNVAAECRMPLCYGGGVKTVDQVVRIVKMGVEKVAISSAAIDNPELVGAIAAHVGSQSVVVVLDVKASGPAGARQVWTHNGQRNTGLDPYDVARRVADLGAGELTLNSIDRDGTMGGYDLEIARRVRAGAGIPMTVLGGAGSLRDIASLVGELGIVGAAAGSLFVFKGVYKAVLINYPARADRMAIHGLARTGARA
jgi:imidazole glycerol-phosphate synthase subunit HisF